MKKKKHKKNEDDEQAGIFASTSKVKFENGLLMKYGRCFGDKEKDLKTFQDAYNITLPQDFISYIGEDCEAGFDGFYQVAKRYEGEILWSHLLLMKLPDATDRQLAPEHIATDVIEKYPFLFRANEKLRYFPFGDAFYARRDYEEGTNGYLVFDTAESYAIYYMSPASRGKRELIASNFKEMIENSKFQYFG